MTSEHKLSEFIEDFVADGVQSRCSCGWISPMCADIQEAGTEHAKHAHGARPYKAEGGQG